MEQINAQNSVLVVKKKQHDLLNNRNEIIQKKKNTTEDCLFEFWRSLVMHRCDTLSSDGA